jgi:glycyl-tRNA synthetase beta chain
MRSDLLFELGTEELPPKALSSLSGALADEFKLRLKQSKISYGDIQIFAAPRRLALLVRNLALTEPDKNIVTWGPPAKVAFAEDGTPTKAGEAFGRKHNIVIPELKNYIEDDGQQEKLCHRVTQKGRLTRDLLGQMLNESLGKLPIPKRMRWGSGKEEFVRPVQWAVLLFGKDVCTEKVLGLQTSNISQGHRFHGSGNIRIDSPLSYEKQLRDNFVIADMNERREIIRLGVTKLANNIKGNAVIDPLLLDEVAALNEWPVPHLGKFDDSFLAIPPEALISSMKEHQKYFHIVDLDGALMPAFITIANISSRDPKQIIEGNERVIRPRLADAVFFYKNDGKISLASRRENLKAIVFQDKLGSVYDKTVRVAALAKEISKPVGADPILAQRAALLSKSDLITDMVGEFSDLQGIMGRYYALNDGEHPDVAEALLEQYLPRFSGDGMPSTEVGAALSIADKLDTLVGIFSIGQQPSGSRDPFALRRASLGLLRIIVNKEIDIDLNEAIRITANQFELSGGQREAICEQVLTYILERFKSWYKDDGLLPEIFLSVAALNLANPLDINARVKAVAHFTSLSEAQDLAAANKRVSNILTKHLKNTEVTPLNMSLLVDKAEIDLSQAIIDLEKVTKTLIDERNYTTALQRLSSLRDPVDQFFNDVMVMTDDISLKNNRLSLLRDLHSLLTHVADISQLARTN